MFCFFIEGNVDISLNLAFFIYITNNKKTKKVVSNLYFISSIFYAIYKFIGDCSIKPKLRTVPTMGYSVDDMGDPQSTLLGLVKPRACWFDRRFGADGEVSCEEDGTYGYSGTRRIDTPMTHCRKHTGAWSVASGRGTRELSSGDASRTAS